MAPSQSKVFSARGEGVYAEEESKACSMSGEGLKHNELDKLKEEIEALKLEMKELQSKLLRAEIESTTLKAKLSEKAKRMTVVSAEEDSKGSSSSGEGVFDEEDSRGFPICGAAASTEEFLDDSKSSASPAAKSERVKCPENESLFKGTKFDVGMWSKLDDHLLERIIARLRFKFLFQASSLSKTWRDRFSSQQFQREVQRSSSSSWESYAPLFVNDKKDLVGYERGSKRWHRLPTHSYVQQDVALEWKLRVAAGSLLCWTCVSPIQIADPHGTYRNICDVHVTNPLTRSWKQLPTRPRMQWPEIVHIGLEAGSKAYKVILGTLQQRTQPVCIYVQIFDSTSDSWTMGSFNPVHCSLFAITLGGSVFISGIFYVLVYKLGRAPGYVLISFNVKEKTWKEIPHLHEVLDGEWNPHHQPMKFDVFESSEVVICGSNVMLVISHTDKVWKDHSEEDSHEYTCGAISVFRMNLERGLAFKVSQAPDKIVGPYRCLAAGQGDCIHIGPLLPNVPSILYNVGTEEWHWLNSAEDSPLSFSGTPMIWWRRTSVAYQPGLNPFLKV